MAIEIPDDRTLKVTLENPTPFFLRLTALPAYLPQNQEFVERQGERYAQSTEALLYNGPYILTDLAPPQGATFAKNEDYWDKEYVDIERVEGKVVKDVSTAVNLHEAGELDVTELSTEYVNGYEGSPAFEPMVMFATNYLDMNQDSPTFCNENIRKAMQVGFDRDALADKILNDGSVGAKGFVPPGGILEARESKRSARPPARSWDGSTRSGPGRSTSRASRRSARNRTLRCWSGTIAGSGTSGPSCSPVRGKARGQSRGEALPFNNLVEQTAAGNYGGSMAAYNDPMDFLKVWTTDSPLNQSGFSNAEYDRLVAKVETDPTRRFQHLAQAEKILIKDEAVLTPTFHVCFTRLIRPSVESLVFHPYGVFVDFKYASIQED